jgi:hypothetical protein
MRLHQLIAYLIALAIVQPLRQKHQLGKDGLDQVQFCN